MAEFSEAYLDDMREDISYKIEKAMAYAEHEDTRKVLRRAEDLLRSDTPEQIFTSRLLYVAVIEKMREEKEGKKWIELDRKAFDLKEISLAGLHGGPIVGLIAYAVRKITDRITGETAFKIKIGKIAFRELTSLDISDTYKQHLKEIIKERVKRTF